MLDAHLSVIADRFQCVLPGETLSAARSNVCLTFDDAYADFNSVVFPMLCKHDLRCVLAVPTALIREGDGIAGGESQGSLSSEKPTRLDDSAHCSWPELIALAASGRVALAAHGHTHCRLDLAETDLHSEIERPGALLAARTGRSVDSFVLPYGRFDARVLAFARRHYRHVFRIGGADNAGWGADIIYRVDADRLTAPASLFSGRRLLGYRLRRRWNMLRSR